MNIGLIAFLLFLSWINRKLIKRIREMKEEVAEVNRQAKNYTY